MFLLLILLLPCTHTQTQPYTDTNVNTHTHTQTRALPPKCYWLLVIYRNPLKSLGDFSSFSRFGYFLLLHSFMFAIYFIIFYCIFFVCVSCYFVFMFFSLYSFRNFSWYWYSLLSRFVHLSIWLFCILNFLLTKATTNSNNNQNRIHSNVWVKIFEQTFFIPFIHSFHSSDLSSECKSQIRTNSQKREKGKCTHRNFETYKMSWDTQFLWIFVVVSEWIFFFGGINSILLSFPWFQFDFGVFECVEKK